MGGWVVSIECLNQADGNLTKLKGLHPHNVYGQLVSKYEIVQVPLNHDHYTLHPLRKTETLKQVNNRCASRQKHQVVEFGAIRGFKAPLSQQMLDTHTQIFQNCIATVLLLAMQNSFPSDNELLLQY